VTARHYRGSGRPGEPIDRRPGAVDRIPNDDRAETRSQRVAGVVWGAAWEVARRLPEPVAFGVAALAARLAHRFARRARSQVRANLTRVVGAGPEADLDRVVRDAFASYARYWVEAFRAADIPGEVVQRRTTEAGFEHLDAALDQGRGAIVLLAHHGSWDTAARWGETTGYHLAVVAEVVRPRVLFAKFVRLREAIGLEVVPLRRGDDMRGRLSEVLAANHMVGLLSDRDLSGTAPVVSFFGEDARIPPGPVILSRRTGAPIVPITMLQRPGRTWHVQALPALDVSGGDLTAGCQVLARALEDLIRTDPAQWHAFSPVWLADLPAHRRGDWVPPASAPEASSG
jgi:phosphatidylinositol dimannoside acyltransferase